MGRKVARNQTNYHITTVAKFVVRLSTHYHCALERAFKSPMLCDVTKVHTGMGVMPRVVGVSNEKNWGQPGGSKRIHVAPSISQKGGEASTDRMLERIENKYWKIEVSEFSAWMLGFYKFIGEWETIELAPNQIQINYTYTLHANSALFYPLQWLFATLFWPRYMNQVLENVRKLAYTNEPYQNA